MKENKLIKILIPIVALVVVFESIVLVSRLGKGTVESDNLIEEKKGNKQTVEQKEIEEAVADFVWETETTEMKIGKAYKVTLNLLVKRDLKLDSIETYTYFNPKLAIVSGLVTNKEVGQDLSKVGVDNKTGVVSSILWSGDKRGVGYEIKNGETVKVLSFVVTPKVLGKLSFNLSTSMSDSKYASVIQETDVVGKSLVYHANELEINVIK